MTSEKNTYYEDLEEWPANTKCSNMPKIDSIYTPNLEVTRWLCVWYFIDFNGIIAESIQSLYYKSKDDYCHFINKKIGYFTIENLS